ncbi:MAG TPA: hypothetical protein VFX48_00960 [Saprospiraceae bacterium]|nr:hypothetical protein [Saprospiraceae bacterium]
MTVRNQIRFIVYRMHEKGLEVLLTKSQDASGSWSLTNARGGLEQISNPKLQNGLIELENTDASGVRTIAIEADWHELPRIRQLVAQDLHLVKDVIMNKWPEMEAKYVAVKEAFKKTLPQEYAVLKELKDILLDRNSVKNI